MVEKWRWKNGDDRQGQCLATLHASLGVTSVQQVAELPMASSIVLRSSHRPSASEN